jgi:hypothetical protein
MHIPRTAATLGLLGFWCALALGQTTIRRVTVFPSGNTVQVEINASDPVTPQSQLVTNPDRLVIDFPNSVPGSDLHNLTINRGQIKGLRVGLFGQNPPVTRVVVDLDGPQRYEIFPAGSTIVLKLNANGDPVASSARPGLTSVSLNPGSMTGAPMNQPSTSAIIPTPAAPPAPRMSVDFRSGKLKIFSDRATLAEGLSEVRRRTGADISIPAGAAQEQVFGTFGPASSRDVMVALLNGSRFNFVMVGADNDPSQLRSVLLTPRDGSPVSVPAISNPQPSATIENQPDPGDNAVVPEAEVPTVDDPPNPDPAENDNSQAEPDMSPRHHHRRGSADTPPPQ